MHDNIIILSILLSLIFSEITGISPSGIIVPGYFAINLNNPSRVIYTLILALATQILVKIFSNFTIIYGRRRFVIMIITSFLLNILFIKIELLSFNPNPIGVIIPGIIANQFERQGILVSFAGLFIVTSLVALIMMLFSIPVFG